ncbi:MAG: 2-amino-4-hydroxy-6-hydroxymethyldihydropteridine diphosphokinase [Gammaproteobacteria bacterium]|nr:2-amino-4-hydroxy-6-hydroxymethyldihydropteridine diphosphokinase [Gammaproteobacteria bacterium]
MPKCVYIGLGSNLDDPVAQLKRGFVALDSLPASCCMRRSSLYRSAPLGPAGQPDYINAVAELETALSAQELLAQLQAIEAHHGRVRGGERWAARVLDLDILLYADVRMHDAVLTIPHAEMLAREFVLYPLFEIAPALEIPGAGNLKQWVERCPARGLERIE